VALVSVGVEFALSVVVALLYNAHVAQASTWDFGVRWVVSAPLGLAYDVALDGISLALVLLSTLVALVAMLSDRAPRREPAYLAWQLLALDFTVGAFVAHDLLLFFIFFELVLVPSYFMVAQWGGPSARRAAMKFFLYTFSGSAPALVAVIYLGFLHQHEVGGNLSFNYSALSSTVMTSSQAVWIFVGLALAFAIKAPLWPLHSWSPPTYGEAPVAAGAQLAATLSKLGTYGLLRFALALTPLAVKSVTPVMLALSVIAIVYGSFVAATSRDLRRLAVFSSVAQMGFITLGIFSGSQIGVTGAVVLMVVHGVTTLGLFVLIGALERRRGSARLDDVRGLQGVVPVLSGFVTVVALATIGVPGLGGFVGEFLILLGAFGVHPAYAAVATLGTVGAAVYWLWAYQRAFHGPLSENATGIVDASPTERALLWPVVALVVAMGVVPAPLLSRVAPSVQQIVAHVTPTGVSR
jgi:NADH-quinone oxidoreductase subunit M